MGVLRLTLQGIYEARVLGASELLGSHSRCHCGIVYEHLPWESL
jgi:hypothetical protein